MTLEPVNHVARDFDPLPLGFLDHGTRLIGGTAFTPVHIREHSSIARLDAVLHSIASRRFQLRQLFRVHQVDTSTDGKMNFETTADKFLAKIYEPLLVNVEGRIPEIEFADA